MKNNSFHSLPLRRASVQGLDIPEYELVGERLDGSSKLWVFDDWEDCSPEEYVGFYLRERLDCDVMFREGEMVRCLLDALCLAAFAENEGYKVISKSGGSIRINNARCISTFPSAPFTKAYVHNFFQEFTVEEVASNWRDLMTLSRYPPEVVHRPENNPRVLEAFLEALTIPRLLTMFDIALANNGTMSGWPDLTVMKDGQLSFVEVKVKDRLTPRQIDWIRKYASLPGIDYQVIRLAPQ